MATCSTCRFFQKKSLLDQGGKGNQGNCVRFPPKIIHFPVQGPAGPSINIQSMYPTVTTEWPSCGEYENSMLKEFQE